MNKARDLLFSEAQKLKNRAKEQRRKADMCIGLAEKMEKDARELEDQAKKIS